MKRQVRRSVFETNSSSVHTITICEKSEFDDWVAGKTLLYNGWSSGFLCDDPPESDHFYSRDQAIEYQKKSEWYKEGSVDFSNKEAVDEWLRENDWYDYEYYGDGYERFKENYITGSGETIVAFGYYGENY